MGEMQLSPDRPMRAFLILRCNKCKDQAFRCPRAAEGHVSQEHGGRVTFTADWVGLPENYCEGGLPI